VRPRLGVVLLVLAAAGCASRDDVTPMIVVSPGAKERIMVMDRFRHHGAPRRWLPKVTVEEIDDAELPPTGGEESATEDVDAGAPER